MSYCTFKWKSGTTFRLCSIKITYISFLWAAQLNVTAEAKPLFSLLILS